MSEQQYSYTSVKVPSVLAKKIKTIAEQEGYRSVSEFMMEAARMRLRDLEKK